MSGLMNALGLGHKDHKDASSHSHAADDVAHAAGKAHTATVEKNAAHGATTTTTTTTTNNPAAVHGAAGTTAPYGTSTASSTARTGAAYTNTGAAAQSAAYTERSGVSSEDAMTRSEEQLRVAKATVEVGKAELNKYVETRHVEQAVPVTRERVVIEREPITQTNIGDAMSGATISEAHYETTLHEDRVAATKETVPIERIRLAKQVETSVESVGADLRKEHIDFTQTSLNDKVDTTANNLHGQKIDTTANMHATKGINNTTTTGTTNTSRSAY